MEDNDFEVVSQEMDDDAEMWDVENENEDDIKQSHIQSMFLASI